jgi:hypothetical protein
MILTNGAPHALGLGSGLFAFRATPIGPGPIDFPEDGLEGHTRISLQLNKSCWERSRGGVVQASTVSLLLVAAGVCLHSISTFHVRELINRTVWS